MASQKDVIVLLGFALRGLYLGGFSSLIIATNL